VSLRDKICAPADLVPRMTVLPRPMVFTNGVFDILHRGHVEYLERARALGASLVVGLNTDRSARRLDKGAGRPFNTEADRAALLAALESVSAVVPFDERTPVALIHIVRPDVYVKGGDYALESLPEAPVMQALGGRTVILPFAAGYSTSSLVERILATGTRPPALHARGA
jgi:rfaE bifunctional protein nucleotidyltransferase chain/domain